MWKTCTTEERGGNKGYIYIYIYLRKDKKMTHHYIMRQGAYKDMFSIVWADSLHLRIVCFPRETPLEET